MPLNGNELLRLHEIQTIKVRPFWWRPTVHILMVTDASGSFDNQDFGLEKVLTELKDDP